MCPSLREFEDAFEVPAWIKAHRLIWLQKPPKYKLSKAAHFRLQKSRTLNIPCHARIPSLVFLRNVLYLLNDVHVATFWVTSSCCLFLVFGGRAVGRHGLLLCHDRDGWGWSARRGTPGKSRYLKVTVRSGIFNALLHQYIKPHSIIKYDIRARALLNSLLYRIRKHLVKRRQIFEPWTVH